MTLQGTQRINAAGHLEVGGCDTVALAREFGTPLYVLDEAELRGRCSAYRQAFQARYPHTGVAYAGKALLTTAVARIVEQEGLELDVASGGELTTALAADFPAHRITLHGNFKLQSELELALHQGVGRIVVDSMLELSQLAELAKRLLKRPTIVLRVAPGVDPHTHGKISTGQDDTKFGFNISNGAAEAGVIEALRHPELHLTGFHAHVGSQLLDTEAHEAAAHIICQFAATMRDHYQLTIRDLILGGGLGIQYLPEQLPPSIESFAKQLTSAFSKALHRYDLGTPHLGIEPGRSIAGEAGLTLYTVGPIKHAPIAAAPGERVYVAIDGGLSDNPRPLMYDARYQALLANRAAEAATFTVRVAGRHCETDTLLPSVDLPFPAAGDILAVLATGAYNYAMASNYNRFPRPAMILVRDGTAEVIVRRETVDDLLRQDVIPERLRATSPLKV
ncbi:MAG: diaminopimelate decarboxylase [Chloroflexi bacterium]|nr:diaminopimelate decarboxylase [Chloroflexota bacterium]